MAHEQHPMRPPFHSQHSSSVPSTPFQQPRDLRFHSRSPSPNRALSNNSPRSVVSEAVAHNHVQRSQPVVCKFETGAEIRKRRIPYVEGGNEELGPPKKEPKRSLEPEEHEKLRTQMDDLYQRLLPSDESEGRRAQLVKKLDRLLNTEWPGNDIRVNVFGSSGNLLASSDSDVDICITTPLKKLESMHSIAMLLHKNGMEKVVCRASAKVPIVKCWDPELNLAADLNVNNPLALENTRMIKTYVQLDDRVRPLAKIIKYWTKRRILNDAAFGGTISSYTWICMIINFLQRRDPPILPSLQKKAEERKQPENGKIPQFADNLDELKSFGGANKETLPDLLFQFFRHYGYEFEYSKYVVSVKEGRLLSRQEKGWDPANHYEKEARNRLCVEEPFTLNRNLGNSADDYAWSGIHGEIRRAFELLADGCQLEKCCEEYEFPVEEKPIFQRPPPKPKPTLTRSASQSGRPTQEPPTGRSRKANNRNQSAQRAGSRRASSGASFSNQRVPLPFQSPPQGGSVVDYFGMKGDLHSQLYQQWQYLQAQTEALRSQLAAQQQHQQQHQQQQQQHGPGRPVDIGGSPHHRAYQPNGLPSPRYLDNPPPTAPLLPGYLYHYPARYPPPSPMSQARTREGGTSTNPSSPSLVAAVPALRRQVHRGSIPEGSTSSLRSQSQPGRSLPHPLTLQQHVHPGYDVSGALPGQYQNVRTSSGAYTSMPPGMQTPFSHALASYAASTQGENSMPKEYVGYYVGQSPSLGPQYPPSTQMQMPPPPMMLRDPPQQRQRRVTPDLMPPMPNGRHSSRSPSPLGHLRSYTTTGDLRSTAVQGLKSPPMRFDVPSEPATAPLPTQKPMEVTAPLIVNGSGTGASSSKQPEKKVNGITSPPHPLYDSGSAKVNGTGFSRTQLPMRPLDTNVIPEHMEKSEQPNHSPRISPSPRLKSGPKLNFSPNSTPVGPNGNSEQFHDSTPIPAPLLSPVAELRTPSPTRPTSFERESPTANGLMKAAKIANARQVAGSENEPPTSPKHERKGSAPNPSSAPKPAKSPEQSTPATSAAASGALHGQGQKMDANPWQQATRKGHKKSKSTGVQQQGAKGQPMPANEAERKGG
ncbi:uncharacterized protein LTR77_001669 [Saxophila tyrrhenica]|uniref:polynucleotide adenylyltransferase n=1 Tax=Saxophila tyrrhenica TaxID=1690608 RepID=A0AAV9PKS1_9PEZI|nr:hypothetical protein LTR77_001669 [Saxophila tyrrhenica]